MNNPKNSESVIYVVRHGETDWNSEGLLQGWTDIALNARGETQAHELRNQFAEVFFDAAYSSDLSRAQKTAEIICHGRGLQVAATRSLREGFKGPLEGQKISSSQWNEIDKTRSALPRDQFLNYKLHPEIDSSADIFGRIDPFLRQCFNQHQGQLVLIVSHAGVLRSILDHVHSPLPAHQRWSIENCAWLQLIQKESAIQIGKLHKAKIITLQS